MAETRTSSGIVSHKHCELVLINIGISIYIQSFWHLGKVIKKYI